ncbi:MAG: hypothetical protein MUO76_00145 [Anaerolineaceae bacterium]|nr:hypothetical protein [Anaerolineaceae bacterium]
MDKITLCGRYGQLDILTSNCEEGVSILSLGEILVHPLYRVDNKLPIQSIVSILSTLVAPRLHLNRTKSTGLAARFQKNL